MGVPAGPRVLRGFAGERPTSVHGLAPDLKPPVPQLPRNVGCSKRIEPRHDARCRAVVAIDLQIVLQDFSLSWGEAG